MALTGQKQFSPRLRGRRSSVIRRTTPASPGPPGLGGAVAVSPRESPNKRGSGKQSRRPISLNPPINIIEDGCVFKAEIDCGYRSYGVIYHCKYYSDEGTEQGGVTRELSWVGRG
ncbi:hypothetical protein SKAU_G00215900 [Synaphobranchus kaupii]|uniref:Uncharacterized protein n=1 Tax=Synaphobranchus kaupii TaxID=118154 RepID=A0A9Q1F9T8_SYNKA|nr:hypothetical protein SKAU_G00215900 [Synaphobranchus kaupii]